MNAIRWLLGQLEDAIGDLLGYGNCAVCGRSGWHAEYFPRDGGDWRRIGAQRPQNSRALRAAIRQTWDSNRVGCQVHRGEAPNV